MSSALKARILAQAEQLGFTLAGVTDCEPPASWERYENWIEAGYHGEMRYLATPRNLERRAAPRRIAPDCQSILVLGMPYTPAERSAPPPTQGRIASYAFGEDYHLVIARQLQKLSDFIHQEAQLPPEQSLRYYTDTGAILEHDLAYRAGLGWIGKNSLLINPRQGSYFFLAEIFLPIALPPDEPYLSDHCGSCTRCLDACPTDAILPNRTVDARRCISYLTIELRDSIPEPLREKTGNWIFGCDLCQIACPWNRFAAVPPDDAPIPPRRGADAPDLSAEMTRYPDNRSFNLAFKTSPIKRSKRRGYLRNVAVAVGNSGDAALIPALEVLHQDEDDLVREHALWALKKLNGEKEE